MSDGVVEGKLIKTESMSGVAESFIHLRRQWQLFGAYKAQMILKPVLEMKNQSSKNIES